ALIDKETADPRTWQWTAADKLFLDLVRRAHERGMHIIIDGVFNHTGRDFFAFKDIRQSQKNSRYKDWYSIESFDDPRTKRNEFAYKGWWGHMTLPTFAATRDGKDMHPGPKAYIFEATKRWMQPHGKLAEGIDGWRLDVAEERPTKFWADWHALVRQLNPNAYTTAEIWSNAAEFVRKDGFSASMNYNAFAIPVKGFLIDNNVSPTKFGELLESRRKQFPTAVAAVMQNLTDSHDTDRLASMIVNGPNAPAPSGDDIVFNKNNTPASSDSYDNRKPMLWQDRQYEPEATDPRGREREPDEVKFDRDLFNFYKNAIALRRQHDALNHGDFAIVATDDTQRVIVTSRKSKRESLVVAINRSNEDAHVDLPLNATSLTPIFVTRGDMEAVKVQGSQITVPALTGAVFSAN